MLFSSTLFLFRFLPLVLAGHFAVRRELRNALLLAASLCFYAWGEPLFVGVMLLSIVINWRLGRWLGARRAARAPLALAVAVNLLPLVVFKYADWLTEAGVGLLQLLGAEVAAPRLGELWPADSPLREALFTADGGIHLPLGISFFTFQALSYVIDVHRGHAAPRRSLVDTALYIALFPQLVAGPIVRYTQIAAQLDDREVGVAQFAAGVRRFVVGLAKKMLVANTLAPIADAAFAVPPDQLPASVAWLGLLAYSAQIYFDFSGYSDMAIGLGRMLGFHFPENFDYPYVARSLTGFWRRWHISLSTWFRDYLYIPLGGNRRGLRRTYLNLLIVFTLCGLWHGASASFLVWGLFHGGFLALERAGLLRWLDGRPAALRHVYTLLVVMVGWVFFRAETLGHAAAYLGAMVGVHGELAPGQHVAAHLHGTRTWALLAAVVGSAPLVPWLAARLQRAEHAGRERLADCGRAAALLALVVMFALACTLMAAQTYKPFLYFRF